MQRDTAASATPPVIDAVLDLIRPLRLAYAPVIAGGESSDRIYHVLHVLAGQVSAHEVRLCRTPPIRLAGAVGQRHISATMAACRVDAVVGAGAHPAAGKKSPTLGSDRGLTRGRNRRLS